MSLVRCCCIGCSGCQKDKGSARQKVCDGEVDNQNFDGQCEQRACNRQILNAISFIERKGIKSSLTCDALTCHQRPKRDHTTFFTIGSHSKEKIWLSESILDDA